MELALEAMLRSVFYTATRDNANVCSHVEVHAPIECKGQGATFAVVAMTADSQLGKRGKHKPIGTAREKQPPL